MNEQDKNAHKIKVPRQHAPERQPEIRSRNFDEVSLGYTPEMARLEASRCLQCKKPKCVLGCPVHVNIPAFIKLVSEGDFLGAAKVIKEDNYLPAVTGRVCPQEHQCEKYCVTGLKGDPVAIGILERFVADYERRYGKDEPFTPPPPTGKKVAIIGAGPAGLTAAGVLAKLGHEVIIFEALHKPGGVLFYGIPEFRLPKEIVEAEVALLCKMGVRIKTNYIIGKIKSLDELLHRDGFDAVFIGTGSGLPYFLGIAGENLNAVYSANEFLTRINLMRAWEFPRFDTPIHAHKQYAIIGGGNTALDAARTAIRLPGTQKAYILYRRSDKEMPARNEEIEHAKAEGIEFLFLTAPIKIIDNNGWVAGIECVKMQLGEPDSTGRRRPIPIDGSNFIMDVDAVIIAIGGGSNPLITRSAPDLKTNKYGNIEVIDDETGQTAKAGVFAGGDIVTGAATVIEAMGAGKKAAQGIHDYIMNRESRVTETQP